MSGRRQLLDLGGGSGCYCIVAAQAGDFTRDPMPSASDVIIMVSNLPQYSREIIGAVSGGPSPCSSGAARCT